MINGKTATRGKSNKGEHLKKYKITNILIAKWFNYSSANSFSGSSRKDDVRNGIEQLIKYIESVKNT